MQPKIDSIFKNGRNQVILSPCPCPKSWDAFFKETPLPSEDFMLTRENLPIQAECLPL